MGKVEQKIRIKTVVVGYLETNCYLIGDAKGDAVVIDPGGNPERILLEIDKNFYRPFCILITHSHSDHISGLEGVLRHWQIPVLMHWTELDFLRIPKMKISRFRGQVSSEPGYYALEDGDVIGRNGWEINVIFTPGHTPGGVCYRSGDMVFTGDTLFQDGVGRTDFEGGNEGALMRSITERLLVLEDHIKIYPGHGPSSTIGRERGCF